MKKSRKFGILLTTLLVVTAVATMLVFAGCDKKVTVTFMNGDAVHSIVTGEAGVDLPPQTAPEKTGYEFGGWKDAGGAAFTQTAFPEKSTTVYANFTPNPYKVEFNAGKGSGLPVTVDATYDTPVSVPDAAKRFERTGFELAGWAKTKDADAADYNVNDSLLNLTENKDEKVTLYGYYVPTAVEADFVYDGDTVVAYVGNDEIISLPKKYSKIGEHAFEGNTALKEVIIPDSYTEIGFGAFEGCDNLEAISVPFIGGGNQDNAFLAYIFGAATYKDNTFAYNLTNVGAGSGSEIDMNTLTGSFFIPQSLRIVTVNTEIDTIPEGAFYYAFGLEKVLAHRFTDDEIPDKDSVYTYRIKTVGKSAFEGCHRIGYDTKADVEYAMPWLSEVETIGEAAFKGYVANNDYFTSKMRTLGVLSEIRTIGKEAFAYNNGLGSVVFGNHLQRIEESAFKSVNLLQQVEIPDSCTYIGDYAFQQCIYLSSVTIGANVEYVGKEAFALSAGLTEVFFKGALPQTLSEDAFHGLDIYTDDKGDEQMRPVENDCNKGLVFYNYNWSESRSAAAETTLKTHCPSSQVKKAGEERGPFYYIGSSGKYEFSMKFSAGHTIIISDPYYRSGIGLPTIVGTYTKAADAWYGVEIYTLRILLDVDFTVKLDYYLSSTLTHYYIYKVDTFTMSEVIEETQNGFKIGNKADDEWYLEENKYGQIGLWHNGEMVEIQKDKGATYVVGGISQYYDDRTIRTFVYRQGNEYFEEVVTYEFVYVPDDNAKDDMFVYYGTLHLDETGQNMLFGNYESSDKKVVITVDAQVDAVTVRKDGNIVAKGKYSSSDVYGSYTTSVGESGETVKNYKNYTIVSADKGLTLTFTDFLESFVDNEILRSTYARCRIELDGETYVLYNTKYSSHTDAYFVTSTGSRSTDRYVLMQYEQRIEVGEGEEADIMQMYPGFGEHFYDYQGETHRVYLTYKYEESETGMVYNFTEDNGGKYTASVKDEFIGTFEADMRGSQGGAKRVYSPFYVDEENAVFTDGKIKIVTSGYGTATLTDENGAEIKGKYNVVSDEPVSQVYISERTYYNLVEYVFRSDNGELTEYFVPNFYDAFDGSMKKGDMLRPDSTRGNVYRIYDSISKVCTGRFVSTGYGMGLFYLMVNPKTNQTVGVDNYFFAPGATYAHYEVVGEQGGSPVYRLKNGLGLGFFTWTASDKKILGYAGGELSREPAYVMYVGNEYENWWKSTAALLITGDLSPSVDEMQLMVSREEKGVYTAPNGYTMELDGNGTATLKNASGVLVHTAKYGSVDAGKLNMKRYPMNYTVGGVTYTGSIDVSAGIVRMALTDGATKIDNFIKNDPDSEFPKDFTGEGDKFTLYKDNYVGRYNASAQTYNIGSYEVDEATGNYILRFDDRKYVVTLDETAKTYTVVQSFAAIKMEPADYRAKAYYPATEKDEYTCDLYGYKVRADKDGNPVLNEKSEYAETLIDTQNDVYWYQGSMYKIDSLCYEDCELSVTYALLGIIEITNSSTYYPPENNKKAFIIIDRGNAIVLYEYIGQSAG